MTSNKRVSFETTCITLRGYIFELRLNPNVLEREESTHNPLPNKDAFLFRVSPLCKPSNQMVRMLYGAYLPKRFFLVKVLLF